MIPRTKFLRDAHIHECDTCGRWPCSDGNCKLGWTAKCEAHK
jgi:hypothetical protein